MNRGRISLALLWQICMIVGLVMPSAYAVAHAYYAVASVWVARPEMKFGPARPCFCFLLRTLRAKSMGFKKLKRKRQANRLQVHRKIVFISFRKKKVLISSCIMYSKNDTVQHHDTEQSHKQNAPRDHKNVLISSRKDAQS